jgi:hypothetical protein
MVSEKKLEANRRNAQHSTGPRTPEGKAASALNSVVHGVRARHAVLILEQWPEFRQLCADLMDEWQPQTPSETFQVEQMAVIRWKLGRLDAAESSAILQSTEFHLAFKNLEEFKTEKGAIRLPEMICKRETEALRNIDRYGQMICRLERSYYRALEILQRLQDRREGKQRRQRRTEPAGIEVVEAPALKVAAAGAATAEQAVTEAAQPVPPVLNNPAKGIDPPAAI